MSAVFIAVIDGQRVLDTGSGVVIYSGGVDEASGYGSSYVLTCAHVLKSISLRSINNKGARILVNGLNATKIEDGALEEFDLALLKVPGRLQDSEGKGMVAASFKLSSSQSATNRCTGFVNFFKDQYRGLEVICAVEELVPAITSTGKSISYLKLQAKQRSELFRKGLSGAAIFDAGNRVVGIARILDLAEEVDSSENSTTLAKQQSKTAYAIKVTPTIIEILKRSVPGLQSHDKKGAKKPMAVADDKSISRESDSPPQPDTPNPNSLKIDDIQKDRWGSQKTGFGREILIERVEMFSRVFSFDVVLRSTDKSELTGPVVFHLHNTFPRSVIWIRKISKGRAVLQEVIASGTFTIGVQFKDKDGKWQSLEYDIAKENPELRKYD